MEPEVFWASFFIITVLSITSAIYFNERTETPLDKCFDNCLGSTYTDSMKFECTTMCAANFRNISCEAPEFSTTRGVSVG